STLAAKLVPLAITNLPTSGQAATAEAVGSVGGIVALVGSESQATNNATVDAGIAASAVINVAGALLLVANANTLQSANASNSSVGLIAGGAAKSTASANNTTTQATVGNNPRITTGTMSISAAGSDNNFAATTAGAGGVAAGVATQPTTNDMGAVTTASIG